MSWSSPYASTSKYWNVHKATCYRTKVNGWFRRSNVGSVWNGLYLCLQSFKGHANGPSRDRLSVSSKRYFYLMRWMAQSEAYSMESSLTSLFSVKVPRVRGIVECLTNLRSTYYQKLFCESLGVAKSHLLFQ